MLFNSVIFSWLMTALFIVPLPVHMQTECPENYLQCLNLDGSVECFNSTLICENSTSFGVNISLQNLCNGTVDHQDLCNGTVDCPGGSGWNATLCSEIYPSPVITLSITNGDSTQASYVFTSSSSNSVTVPAASYLTMNCSVNNNTIGMDYTITWSSPFQSTLCAPVISEDGRSWSQVVTSVLNGNHTCGYLLGNEMAPVNTFVSVIVEGSGLFYRYNNIGIPILNNSAIYLDNSSSSPLEVWCASDLLYNVFNTSYTHSLAGVENTELLNSNTSSAFEFCGPSFRVKFNEEDVVFWSSQGVYTCQVMVAGGYRADLSFGLYNAGFKPALSLISVTIDSEADDFTLVCSTIGSPPTKVHWNFNGTPLQSTSDTESIILRDGDSVIQYMTIQRVVNRTSALYDNKLVFTSNMDAAANFNVTVLLGMYFCTVSNSITMFNPNNSRSLVVTGLHFVNEEHVIGRRSRVICITDLPGIVVKWYAEGSSRAIVTSLGSSAELVFDPVNATLNGTSYRCTTKTYYGLQEEQITILVTGPVCTPGCQNGGTCEIVGTQMLPSCNCINGYSGVSCQCPPGTVENGTECIATPTGTLPMVASVSVQPFTSVNVPPAPPTTTAPLPSPTGTDVGGVPGGLPSSDRMLAIIVGAGGGGLILLVVVIVACFVLIVCKTKRKNVKGTTTQVYTIDRNPHNSNDILYDSIDDLNNGAWSSRTSVVPPPIIARSDDSWEVDFSRLKLKQKLGNGAFGAVHKAELTGESENTLPQVVAVKLLKDDFTESERSILIGEIDLMKSLEPHPHVIQMIGSSVTEERVALIMEYCHHGNLKEYLKKNNSNFQSFPISRRESAASIGGLSVYSRTSKNSVDYGNGTYLYVEPNNVLSPTALKENEELSLHALLSFGRQITLGMEYLSQHNIVHGDLAARNILVCKDFRVKISDFGLSNDLYKDISCVGRGCKVPLRWMAIEAMIEKKFTTESDVWSFGVVLWEIFSLGASPYPGLKNAEVIEYIARGERLQKPTNCPEFLYKKIEECWNEEPSERPSFGTMRGHLDSTIATTEEAEEYMLLIGKRNQ